MSNVQTWKNREEPKYGKTDEDMQEKTDACEKHAASAILIIPVN